MIFPFLTLFLIFATVTFVTMRRSTNNYKREQEKFFERERLANSVRKQPINDLNYISIDISKIPMPESNNERTIDLQNEMQKLSKLTIANLSEYTNTDLKLKYGAANLPALTDFDQNYTSMCRIFYELSLQYYNEGFTQEAKRLLEYGIECGTDLNTHYLLLADIYVSEGTIEKIDSLINSAENLKTLLKDSLLRKLEEKKSFTDKMNVVLSDEPLENLEL